MSENTSYFMNAQVADHFGTATAADERIHREMNGTVDSPALVETHFVGFNVPEANLHCLNYLWLHPNLDLMSGGAWAWQGIKDATLQAELFDMRDFMPMTKDEIDSFELPNSYRIETITPLEKVRMTYADPARGNAFDVTLDAIMPPAMLPSGKHFDQAMRTSGTVTLNGATHTVDGYSIRDRSWAEARTEDPMPVQPIQYLAMLFDDDFAVHVTGVESPATASWREKFAGSEELAATMNRGWVWAEGELRTLTACTIETRYEGIRPVGHTVKITDDSGRDYVLEGTVPASCTWNTWSNVHMAIGLGVWTCDGKTGYGDSQVAFWTDFLRAIS